MYYLIVVDKAYKSLDYSLIYQVYISNTDFSLYAVVNIVKYAIIVKYNATIVGLHLSAFL